MLSNGDVNEREFWDDAMQEDGRPGGRDTMTVNNSYP